VDVKEEFVLTVGDPADSALQYVDAIAGCYVAYRRALWIIRSFGCFKQLSFLSRAYVHGSI
jgi:hypothetical protein